MSNWRDAIKEVSTWYKGLTEGQKEEAAEMLRAMLVSPATPQRDGSLNEVLASMLADTRQRLLDNANNVVDDFARDVEYNFDWEIRRLTGVDEDNARLRKLVGEAGDDFEWSVVLEKVVAFYEAAKKRYESHGDVDAIWWVQNRLNPEWEVRDWYVQPGHPEYSGADIRAMLIERQYRPEAIHIDDAKMYKMPISPGGGGPHGGNWGNAYYMKAMYHYVGLESVAITDKGTIIGIEERHRTAGAAGIVSRFIRPYTADPGSVLPREWNNAIIWPDPQDYTEIRF